MENSSKKEEQKDVNIEKELDIIKHGVGTQETVIKEIGKDLTALAKKVAEMKQNETLLEVKEVTKGEREEQKQAAADLALVYNEISERRKAYHEETKKQSTIERSLEDIKYRTRKQVLEATDAETGKSLYTNDKARETALWEKLSNSEENQKLEADLNECKYRQVELDNEMKTLRDKARVLQRCIEIGFYMNLKEDEQQWV